MREPGAAVRVCFEKSFCLSADVTAAYDPNFSDVYEKRNAAYLNYGIGLCKYTGARGKSGASDADAETVAYIRNLLTRRGSSGRSQSWARWISAAAVPWPCIWPTATLLRWTRGTGSEHACAI